jgi:hypothetical protein
MRHDVMRALAASALLLLLAAAACAPGRIALPEGQGQPITNWNPAVFERAIEACRSVRTMRGEIRVSGRVEGERLRATLLFGLERPDAIRVEALAPFGAPVFILAARGQSGTLLLRDGRAVVGPPPSEMLEALVPGVRLDPDSLAAVLSGCVVPSPDPSNPRAFGPDWMSVQTGGATLSYLHREKGEWRVVSGERPDLLVGYSEFSQGLPRRVRLQSRQAGSVDLTLALTQLSTNVEIPSPAWSVSMPGDARRITLEQLRSEGVMRRDEQEQEEVSR